LSRLYFGRFLDVHIGGPSSNQATSLESQMIHLIQLLPGRTLSVGGCLNIIGSQFWDNANSFKLPQYTLVNGMISCRFPWQGAKISAQLNIKNLFDTAFYQSAGNRYYIISGAPRAILSSLRLEF
jgi:outer membrane receptor for ferric coprogen and ferric-rhodotorulic acid